MKNHGPCIYFDTSCKKVEGTKRHNCYRADITVDDRRYRRRSKDREYLELWLENIKEGNSV
jgi:hypothetical protein